MAVAEKQKQGWKTHGLARLSYYPLEAAEATLASNVYCSKTQQLLLFDLIVLSI